MLIEVEDVGGEEKKFPTNVGDEFLHILLNEPSPIDRPDSRNCPEQGVSHSDAKPFWSLQIKDGKDEFVNSPLPLIPAIPKVESVLRVVLSSKLSLHTNYPCG